MVKSGALSRRGAHYEVDGEGLMHVTTASLDGVSSERRQPARRPRRSRRAAARARRTLIARPDVFGPTARARASAAWSMRSPLGRGAVSLRGPDPRGRVDSMGRIWPGRLSSMASRSATCGVTLQQARSKTAGFMRSTSSRSGSATRCSIRSRCRLARARSQRPHGLAEYRNGGLFVDLGVLVPKHASALTEAHAVDSELIIEWRALTVALLDELAPLVRAELGSTPSACRCQPCSKAHVARAARSPRSAARRRTTDCREERRHRILKEL